jgi:hypothetical protein
MWGCGGGSLKVGEGDVLGGYCINKGKGEKGREVRLMGGRVFVLQGDELGAGSNEGKRDVKR